MIYTVGVSEMAVSDAADDVLITRSLGSCIGISVYDPEAGVGGLAHCLLPASRLDSDQARARPCLFTDTGVAALLAGIFERGASASRVIAKVAGCANLLNAQRMFRIGAQNYTVLREELFKSSIRIDAEDVGGTAVRTMKLVMATGRTSIRKSGVEQELGEGIIRSTCPAYGAAVHSEPAAGDDRS